MSGSFGHLIRVSVFGTSHGEAVGALVEGFPAGEQIDMDALRAFLARRRPNARREADEPIFLSGLYGGCTSGDPLCVIMKNTDARPADYAALADTPRPSHADYPAYVQSRGFADLRGGGQYSGRLTAPLCAAGGIALQMLARRGVTIGAHLLRVGDVSDTPFPMEPSAALLRSVGEKPFPALDDARGEAMRAAIAAVAADHDSVGGEIELIVLGLPVGLGSPMFGGVENRFAQALYGIPAVKGVAFGDGFALCGMRGSQANDPLYYDEQGAVRARTNCGGGAQGGLTNGMPLRVSIAIKPTPSIGLPQETVNLQTGQNTEIEIAGRHDPCIAPRAVPVAEAAAALAALDLILEGKAYDA